MKVFTVPGFHGLFENCRSGFYLQFKDGLINPQAIPNKSGPVEGRDAQALGSDGSEWTTG